MKKLGIYVNNKKENAIKVTEQILSIADTLGFECKVLSGSPKENDKQFNVLPIIIPVLLVAGIVSAILIPLLDGGSENTSTDSPTSSIVDPSTPTDTTTPELQEKAYRFEAECSDIVTDISNLGWGIESSQTIESANNPSGDAYVWNIQKSGNCELTFYVHSSMDAKATLTLCIGLSNERTSKQLFNITVNDELVSHYEPATVFPQWETVENPLKYFNWTDLPVADINLKQGENKVVLTKNLYGLNCLFDIMNALLN